MSIHLAQSILPTKIFSSNPLLYLTGIFRAISLFSIQIAEYLILQITGGGSIRFFSFADLSVLQAIPRMRSLHPYFWLYMGQISIFPFLPMGYTNVYKSVAI